MIKEKKNITDYLDALIDNEEGFRTDVNLSLTPEMLWQLIGALAGVGISIVLIAHLIKNAFPSRQLAENNALLEQIRNGLKG